MHKSFWCFRGLKMQASTIIMRLELIFLVITLSLAPIIVSLRLLNFEEDYYD